VDDVTFLADVDRLLVDAVADLDEAVGPLRLLVGSGSRRRALLLRSLADGAGDAEVATAGAAVELLHLGTLVHDDIVDGADERRHHPALHVAVGLPRAIWAADALYAAAIELVAPVDPDAGPLLTGALHRIACSQVLEAARPPVEDYWVVVDGKTVALFEAVGSLAAALRPGGLPDGVQRTVSWFGRLFQYVDDLHDLTDDQATLGKPVGQDTKNLLHTLPAADLADAPGTVGRRLAELRHRTLEPVAGTDFEVLFTELTEALLASLPAAVR